MRLSEVDFIFFVGSLIGVLGGVPLSVYLTWAFVTNDPTLSTKMYCIAMAILLFGIYNSVRHAVDCVRKLKG